MLSGEHCRWGVDDIYEYPFMYKGGWFDDTQQPKPAFYAFGDFIRKWSTNTIVSTDYNGNALERVFGGNLLWQITD
jgi:hypothetical protein